MELTWYGLSCFRITERGFASVVTDPYNGKVGLPPIKLKAEIVTVSHNAPGHNYVKGVNGYRFAIDGPGEYEIGGTFITGIPTKNVIGGQANVLYVFNFGGLTVAHLGDMAYIPTQSQIEALEEVNVLLVPVGGGRSLNAAQAAEIVSMIEPNIVVPMHYMIPELSLSLESSERFLKEMGISDLKEESSLRLSSGNLPEETEVVFLQPKL